jgi:HD-like signal output (HDOD) protein
MKDNLRAPRDSVGEVLSSRSAASSNPASGVNTQRGMSSLKSLSTLVANLSRGPVDLPCFPNVVIKIRDALSKPDISIEETVKLVGSEPRIAARLIQTANSAAFNPSGRPVTELRTAITRLGQLLVQSAAMAFALQQMKDEPKLRSIAEPLSALWMDSIAVAAISQVIARRTRIKPDVAFLAGLLHGIGRLYIMVQAVDAMAAPGDDPESLELMKAWHPSIGKAVLENWRVGDEIAHAVGHQGDCERELRGAADLTDVLAISIILGNALKQEAPRTIDIEPSAALRRIGMTAEDCAMTVTHAEHQLTSLQEALGC